jgi:glycosyltransferase involved in cell wall biosynthesis
VAVSLRTAPGGFPRKLLNYARTALPVVCFERGAETLEHGSSGWVVPDEDVEAAARGLVRLLDDRALRRRIGRAAREAVWARYDVAAVGARLAALYRTAVR